MMTIDSAAAFRIPPHLATRLCRGTVLLLSALLFLIAARPAAAKSELVVSLKYVPTEAEEVLEKRGVVPVGGPPFEILVVSDGRPEPNDRIGENIEHGGRVPVRARTSITSWVTQVLTNSFREWGTPNSPGAEFLLESELLKLYIVEEHTYKAEVTMKFRIKHRDGTEIWSGVVGGAASRFGRSLKESNYQESLSDALLSCISKLWTDPAFRQSWKAGKPSETAVASSTKPAASQTLAPEAAKAKLLELKEAGFDDDALAAWVRKLAFTRPLTADDMIDWRKAGIPQAPIKAAME